MVLAVEDYVAGEKEDAAVDIVGYVCIKPYNTIAPVQLRAAVRTGGAGGFRCIR